MTNIGAESAEAFTAVTVAVMVADWPCVSVWVLGETAIVKLGVVPVAARTGVTCEVEA